MRTARNNEGKKTFILVIPVGQFMKPLGQHGQGKFVVLLISLLVPGSGGGWAQGPPINTDTAFVNGLEGAALRSFVFSVRRAGLLRDGERIFDPLDRKVLIFAVPVVVPYELIKNRLDVVGVVPILHKQLKLTQAGRREKISTSGIGDAFVLAKYLVLQKDAPGRTTRIALVGRVKFPTGKDDATDRQGNRLPPPLQLGSGSVDYSAGAVFTHVVRRFGFNADFVYDFNTQAQGFEAGDSLKYGFAFGYRLLPAFYRTYPARNHLSAYLELNGEFSRKSRLAGLPVADSGGNVVFLSPGIQLIPSRTFLLEASVRIPVAQELNGTQLRFRPAFIAGIRWLLY